jgi:hypothetical protein
VKAEAARAALPPVPPTPCKARALLAKVIGEHESFPPTRADLVRSKTWELEDEAAAEVYNEHVHYTATKLAGTAVNASFGIVNQILHEKDQLVGDVGALSDALSIAAETVQEAQAEVQALRDTVKDLKDKEKRRIKYYNENILDCVNALRNNIEVDSTDITSAAVAGLQEVFDDACAAITEIHRVSLDTFKEKLAEYVQDATQPEARKRKGSSP